MWYESNNLVWCSQEKKCLGGNGSGPFQGKCAVFEHEFCENDECKMRSSCKKCLGKENCIWCETSGVCAKNSQV